MTLTIALAGKGGVGKTTLAGLLVRYLAEAGLRPILAVDADSNANLNEVLGLASPPTLGEAREEMKSLGAQQPNLTKDRLIEMRVNEALVEEADFDLLVMGRPEGPGCYCAANAVLSASLERLLANYPYIVIDNEAGLEHLSRLVAKRIDHLLVVSDPSRRALVTAGRILELVRSLPLSLGAHYLIVNRVIGSRLPAGAQGVIAQAHLNLIGLIPEDETLAQMDAQGRPIVRELSENSPVVQAAWRAFAELRLR